MPGRSLSLRKRHSNKKKCPCDCGNRVGKCNFRYKLEKIKTVAKRKWFRKQHEIFKKELKRIQANKK